MRGKLLVVSASLVLILLSVLLFLSWYFSNQTVTSAKIADFSPNGYDCPGGIIWNAKFVIVAVNNGKTDLDNLTLTFSTNSPYSIERSVIITDSGNYSLARLSMGQPYLLSTLKSGQNQTVYGYIENNAEDSARIGGYHFVATLRLGDTVLDQSRLMGNFIFYSTT